MVDPLGRRRVNAFYLSLTANAALRLLSAAFDLANSAVGAWPVVGLKAPVLCEVRFACRLWGKRQHPLTSFLADESAMTLVSTEIIANIFTASDLKNVWLGWIADAWEGAVKLKTYL